MNMNAEQLARMFHEIYENEAPNFGYETRNDTREFDPESPNGGLMISVCGKVINELSSVNKRFFSAGFSQGYGADINDIHKVDELFKKTAENIN